MVSHLDSFPVESNHVAKGACVSRFLAAVSQ